MFQIKAVEKIKTHIFIFCDFFEIGAVYEISVEKCVGARGATNDDNLAHARYLLKKQGYIRARTCTRPRVRTPTRTHAHAHVHSDYGIFIAFSLQQWLQERASVLRCTYIACIVVSKMSARFSAT
jgi:hypothetical protein